MRFAGISIGGSQNLTLTERNGIFGYAIISGMQLVAVPEPTSASVLGCGLLAGIVWRRTMRKTR